MTGGLDAVLFDAGNTLLQIDHLRVSRLLEEAGIGSSPERVRAAEREARARLVDRVVEGHAGTEAHLWSEYFRALLTSSGVPAVRLDELEQGLVAAHRKVHLWTGVAEGAVHTLERLASLGYRLGVISNADGRMEGLFHRAGLHGYFEFVLDSEIVGFTKPDPRIFRHASTLLGVPPQRCLYVGDLHAVDVVGAERAGMRALLLDPFGRASDGTPRIGALTELPGYLRRLARA